MHPSPAAHRSGTDIAGSSTTANTPYSPDVPSEQQGALLVEIAERLKALLATSLSTPGDTPKIVGLKNNAQVAIEAGDLAAADDLLAQIEAERVRLRKGGRSAPPVDIAIPLFGYQNSVGALERELARESLPKGRDTPSPLGE
jgi:hypothetical protein